MRNLEIKRAFKYFFAIALIIEIPYLNRFAVVKIAQILFQIAIALIIFIVFLKKSKISKYNILLFLLLGLYIVVTYCCNGNMKGVLSESLGVISISLLLEYGISKERKEIVRGFYWYFALCAFINLLTIIIFPEGMYSVTNMQYESSSNWYLGYKNLHILFLFQYSFWALILDYCEKKKIPKRLICAVIISIASVAMAGSTTSLVGMVIVVLLLSILALNKRTIGIVSFITAYIVAFLSIVLFRLQDRLDSVIYSLTEKHSDFVGRTYIWDSVIRFISEKPLVGYGKEDSIYRQNKTPIWRAVHAHNGILELLYRTGLIGGILALLLIGLAMRQLFIYKESMISKITIIFIVSMSVMLLTEYYAPQFVIFILTFSYNIKYFADHEKKCCK